MPCAQRRSLTARSSSSVTPLSPRSSPIPTRCYPEPRARSSPGSSPWRPTGSSPAITRSCLSSCPTWSTSRSAPRCAWWPASQTYLPFQSAHRPAGTSAEHLNDSSRRLHPAHDSAGRWAGWRGAAWRWVRETTAGTRGRSSLSCPAATMGTTASPRPASTSPTTLQVGGRGGGTRRRRNGGTRFFERDCSLFDPPLAGPHHPLHRGPPCLKRGSSTNDLAEPPPISRSHPAPPNRPQVAACPRVWGRSRARSRLFQRRALEVCVRRASSP